jgi:hypothetical protein
LTFSQSGLFFQYSAGEEPRPGAIRPKAPGPLPAKPKGFRQSQKGGRAGLAFLAAKKAAPIEGPKGVTFFLPIPKARP